MRESSLSDRDTVKKQVICALVGLDQSTYIGRCVNRLWESTTTWTCEGCCKRFKIINVDHNYTIHKCNTYIYHVVLVNGLPHIYGGKLDK